MLSDLNEMTIRRMITFSSFEFIEINSSVCVLDIFDKFNSFPSSLACFRSSFSIKIQATYKNVTQ